MELWKLSRCADRPNAATVYQYQARDPFSRLNNIFVVIMTPS